MNELISTFLAGFLYSVSGIMGLVRHFLLEPKVERIPVTPRWLMNVFFGWSVVLFYVGLRFLTAWFTGSEIAASPPATNIRMLIATSSFIYMGALLYDTITRSKSYTLDELINRFKEL